MNTFSRGENKPRVAFLILLDFPFSGLAGGSGMDMCGSSGIDWFASG